METAEPENHLIDDYQRTDDALRTKTERDQRGESKCADERVRRVRVVVGGVSKTTGQS